MHVDLLGQLIVRRLGAEIPIAAAKPRLVLAVLSEKAGTLVPTHQLVDELWGDHPPASAVRTVQTYVYHLRKLLRLSDTDAAPDRTVLLTRPGGYELRFPVPDSVDTVRFGLLLTEGRRQVAELRWEQAAATLRAALSLWRGPAFAGLDVGPLLSVTRVRLEQARLTALELCLDAELQLGRHPELIDELYGLVHGDPTHEGFSARLMIALRGGDRRAEALQVYHQLRVALDEQLGVPPSGAVQRLFQEVLNDDQGPIPAGRAPLVRATPATRLTLPPRPRLLARDGVGAELRSALRPESAAHSLRVVEVVGPPGAGTSSLVIDAAHEMATHYRDGAVVVDLRGIGVDARPPAVRPLVERLRSAGVRMPPAERLDVLAWRFRTWSANKQLLVVADHVDCPDVLTALRPAGRDSAMIAVNQYGTPGEFGDVLIELDRLDSEAALALLDGLTGGRVDDRAAAWRLVELCEGVPVALCAVARWLTCRPQLPTARAVQELESDPRRLARLWWAGRAVKDSVCDRVQRLPGNALTALQVFCPRPGRRGPAEPDPADGRGAARLGRRQRGGGPGPARRRAPRRRGHRATRRAREPRLPDAQVRALQPARRRRVAVGGGVRARMTGVVRNTSSGGH
jgi:DNA-binding SARP family transcriptional activator